MAGEYDAEAAARFLAEAHENRDDYLNLPDDLAPLTVDEAYEAQDAFARIMSVRDGAVSGAKIATTTKVMQALMGIDHPCGGWILKNRIHQSPARIDLKAHINLMLEFELAVRLGQDLPATGTDYTSQTVMPAVAKIIPAFEMIEDRNAHYKSCKAYTLIAENSWNAGVVLGEELDYVPSRSLRGMAGSLSINGEQQHSGTTDDPLDALAWLANLSASRGQPLRAGHIVITGSIMPTQPVTLGDDVTFTLDDVGSVSLTAV